jgi:hypothetical protein
MSNPLDALIFGIRDVLDGALTLLPKRTAIQFRGAGCSVSDDPTDGATVVDIPGGVAAFPINFPIVLKSADYTVNPIADYAITFTATGHTCTLPPSPTAGDSFEIRTKGTGTTTISGNGKTFDDGNASYVQNPGETTVVRYNGTQWEVH